MATSTIMILVQAFIEGSKDQNGQPTISQDTAIRAAMASLGGEGVSIHSILI